MPLEFKCPTCGSTEGENEGEIIRCRSCGNRYKKEHRNDEDFENLRKAYKDRQDAKFEEAMAEYNRIIHDCEIKNGKDKNAVLEYAYYGKYLCEQMVVLYTKDDGTIIPSFWEINDITPEKSSNFKKALDYAKSGKSENIAHYQEQAKLIEDIKRQYRNLEKSGENYDVFICLKKTMRP